MEEVSSSTVPTRFTSRTEMSNYQRCPRQGYYGFGWRRRGIAAKGTSFEILAGVFIHRGVGRLLHGEQGLEDIITNLRWQFNNEIRSNVGSVITLGCIHEQVCDELFMLIEGLVRGWAFYRLPLILNSYEIEEVEVDRSVPFVEGVELEFKPDGILRDKSTGLCEIFSLKTCGKVDYRKIQDIRTDMQGLSEIWGYEQATGVRCETVLYEFIHTGDKKIETDSFGEKKWVQWSPVVHGWYNAQHNMFAHRYVYDNEEGQEKRLGKGWTRTSAADVQGGSKEWVRALSEGEMFPQAKPYNFPLGEIFDSLQIGRTDEDINEWLESCQEEERRRSDGLLQANTLESLGAWKAYNAALRKYFPKYRHSCNYPLKCQFYEICWNGVLDPLCQGYRLREPHHTNAREATKDIQ